MKRSALLLPALLLAGLGGCASWTVRSETRPSAPLASYRTYQWAAPSPSPEADRLVDQRVRDRVAVDLAQKGIRPATVGETPDFYVEYAVGSGPRVQTVAYDWGRGNNIGGSGQTATPPAPSLQPYAYSEEELVLDFIDARSGRIFWRGYASYVVDRPPEVATGKTDEAVGRILRKYPAVAGTTRPAG
jgi:hypothetical protein